MPRLVLKFVSLRRSSFETFRSALASDEFGVGGTNSTVASPSFLNRSDRFVSLLSLRLAVFQDLGRYSGLLSAIFFLA